MQHYDEQIVDVLQLVLGLDEQIVGEDCWRFLCFYG